MIRFRWAKLQLDRISRLRLTTPASVKAALARLPEDLTQTYESILLDIGATGSADDETPVDHVKAALQLLAFSRHPLYIEEFLDAMAITISPTANWRDVRIGANDLHGLLPGMIELSPEPDWTSLSSPSLRTYFVQFEHFSVKEYVIGEHIRQSHAKDFALEQGLCNRNIADACLLYIYWTFGHEDGQPHYFTEYACLYWVHHMQDENQQGVDAPNTSSNPGRLSREACRQLLAPWCNYASAKYRLPKFAMFLRFLEAFKPPERRIDSGRLKALSTAAIGLIHEVFDVEKAVQATFAPEIDRRYEGRRRPATYGLNRRLALVPELTRSGDAIVVWPGFRSPQVLRHPDMVKIIDEQPGGT